MVGATGFALHKFSDENFARARPRGFCLSRLPVRPALKQKHRCGLQIPAQAKQLACFAHNLIKQKTVRRRFSVLNGRSV